MHGVEHPVCEPEVLRFVGSQVLRKASRAAQDRLDAGQQLARAGQHQVEHDQVEPAAVECFPHRAAIGDRGHAQAILVEIPAEQVPDLGVVVDDQDVVGGVHGVIFG